jgi:hypothetical protein
MISGEDWSLAVSRRVIGATRPEQRRQSSRKKQAWEGQMFRLEMMMMMMMIVFNVRGSKAT